MGNLSPCPSAPRLHGDGVASPGSRRTPSPSNPTLKPRRPPERRCGKSPIVRETECSCVGKEASSHPRHALNGVTLPNGTRVGDFLRRVGRNVCVSGKAVCTPCRTKCLCVGKSCHHPELLEQRARGLIGAGDEASAVPVLLALMETGRQAVAAALASRSSGSASERRRSPTMVHEAGQRTGVSLRTAVSAGREALWGTGY